MSFYNIMLCRDEEKGNHYKAARSITKGSIVFTEDVLLASPLIIRVQEHKSHISNNFISRCANWKCWKVVDAISGKVCEKCRHHIFCSEECYNIIKSIHEKICDQTLLDDSLSIAALYFASGIKMNLSLFPPVSLNCLKKTPKIKILNYINKLRAIFPNIPIDRLITETIHIHFLEIPFRTFIGGYIYAYGLFLFASYFNHSCNPNCYWYTCGKSIFIRASRDIQRGEELTIAYEQEILFTPHSVRKNALYNLLGRDCICERCKNINIAKENMFIAVKNNPEKNPVISHALEELAQPIRINANILLLTCLADTFETYFPISHSFSYELFKKYGSLMWEIGKYEEAIKYLKQLARSIDVWKKFNITDTMFIELWFKVMFYIIISYRYYTHKYEKDSLEFKELNLFALECKLIIEQFLDWRVIEVDEKMYPLFKITMDNAREYEYC